MFVPSPLYLIYRFILWIWNHTGLWVWTYIQFYLIGIWYQIKERLISRKKPHNIGNQMGRVAIVTGGGQGIGLQTVGQMLKLYMTVVLCGPSLEELHIGVRSLRENGIAGGKTHCIHLNLLEFKSIRKFAEDFRSLKLPLDILVNNAGIMFTPFRISKDGYESQWQVNFLGHFLLTHLLLPDLKKSSNPERPARVVNLSSCAHFMGQINWDDIYSKLHYNPQAAYAQSKLAIAMTTRSMSDKLRESGDNVLVNCVHPGVVASNLFENIPWVTKFPWIAQMALLSPRAGSDTPVHVALSYAINCGGHYYEDCSPITPHPSVRDKEQTERLWKIACSSLCIRLSRYGES